ncbi:cob(I)yrinic acid a,c-diamide adenosyltransferase [Bacillaceae bacterium SIJ1]|uniref:cob(I)yrinic acid a,c-diamide adenosyltransferase n=1 Tax=Litoribacterium kuwaitense TaxID=1398745 RepID=UPI0013ED78B0|nr:cob(I)yrinic acid a,c-diamide adenosyltransferase [Litoribacterium kuwaitense]NGP46582.1 cob(I)yrinic acid a,c-diamide adenosyltransferase [Litoribacterium kuwaitense]
MKIYTRTGDQGETSLLYGKRVSKADDRVKAFGTLDEANAQIGLAVCFIKDCTWMGKATFIDRLQRIQSLLFHAGGELSTPADKEVKWTLNDRHVEELEAQIDAWEATLPSLKSFILPGGSRAAGTLHIARTIVRRAERESIGIDGLNSTVLVFLNRLSDYLFVAARYANLKEGVEDHKFVPDEKDND